VWRERFPTKRETHGCITMFVREMVGPGRTDHEPETDVRQPWVGSIVGRGDGFADFGSAAAAVGRPDSADDDPTIHRQLFGLVPVSLQHGTKRQPLWRSKRIQPARRRFAALLRQRYFRRTSRGLPAITLAGNKQLKL